jgi:ABC-type hemin transport system substrate-binding protein
VQTALPDARVVIVDGRDLFWWGIRTPAAIDRLRTQLSR